jgi:FtsP/CotA-like multicopper oxidase with cupredoxin domain
MDGVPWVTQPPVEPGGTFLYEFTPKDAGTYWFHPHLRSPEQVERGLFGLLIVEDPEPPPYSREVVWVLDDWRLGPDGQIDPHFVTPHDLAHDGRWGDVVTVNGRTDTTLEVHPGERLRLRLLDAANGRVFLPRLPGLDAQVIAVDGKYVAAPFALTHFEMAPGNRLDLDVRVPAALAGTTVELRDGYARPERVLARIRVLDEVVPTPGFPSPARAFVPAWKRAGEVAPALEFVLDSKAGGEYGMQWTLNGKAHTHHDHGQGERLDHDVWAKIRFTNVSSRLHPMHIHGQFFKLLTRDGKPVVERFWRDTVLAHPRETIEIGLVPLDAGRWMLHCHILEHAEAGMMTLLEVRPRPAG